MTTIDCLIKSKTCKSSSYVKFKKILKQLFVEPLKTALSRSTTKKESRSFVCFDCHCFVDGSNIHLVDFYDTHVNDIWLFQNKYLDPYMI